MSHELKTMNDEACDWIAKINSGQPSAEDRQRLKQWMGQSPAHEAEIKRMAQLWHELNVLNELAVSVAVPRTSRSWFGGALEGFSIGGNWSTGAFSSLAVFAVLALFWSQLGFNTNGVYHTAVGEQRLVSLSDESTVLLNTNTRMSVKFAEGERNIYLVQGEAHFDVSHNPERPFRVFAGKSLARAVGTAFSVYLRESAVELTVTEGSVAFDSTHDLSNSGAMGERPLGDSSLSQHPTPIIKASQSALFNQLAEVVEGVETISPADLSRKLAWQKGTLQFSGDTLEDVIAEVSRYTQVSIVIVDPELRKLRIGGLFKVGETRKMLRALESSFGVRVDRIDENIIHLSSSAQTAK